MYIIYYTYPIGNKFPSSGLPIGGLMPHLVFDRKKKLTNFQKVLDKNANVLYSFI